MSTSNVWGSISSRVRAMILGMALAVCAATMAVPPAVAYEEVGAPIVQIGEFESAERCEAEASAINEGFERKGSAARVYCEGTALFLDRFAAYSPKDPRDPAPK